jgi:hypothetical protein
MSNWKFRYKRRYFLEIPIAKRRERWIEKEERQKTQECRPKGV